MNFTLLFYILPFLISRISFPFLEKRKDIFSKDSFEYQFIDVKDNFEHNLIYIIFFTPIINIVVACLNIFVFLSYIYNSNKTSGLILFGRIIIKLIVNTFKFFTGIKTTK
jgi:hypothetical protein